MPTTTPTERDVLDAAARIVEAFAATDTERYFAGFAPDASFVFHTEPARLEDRAAYEALWADWIADGWRVTRCVSSNPRVQVFPGGAVFCHDVATSIEAGADAGSRTTDSYAERETIVFRRAADGSLTAVHEHLSPVPDGSDNGKATP
ncbi:YybH family protein [Arthrobacter halodurans]|uniref:Nuclear transport factor 2 family protein n=1 Tax=Arthrobacter halodurans TaxID=516699 RepID=A0ABV4URL3_9MICC